MVAKSPIHRVRSRMFAICPSTTARIFTSGAAASQSKFASIPVASCFGVSSVSKYGNARRPPLPGGVSENAVSSKNVQSDPQSRRTRSRASEPFLKQESDMNPPAGLPNTCP